MEQIEQMEQMVNDLKELIRKQSEILEGAKGLYSPYLDHDIELVQHLRDDLFNKYKK
jgi:hypothetical protein